MGRRLGSLLSPASNREALSIEVGTSIPASRVVRVLDQLVELYGRPQAVRLGAFVALGVGYQSGTK